MGGNPSYDAPRMRYSFASYTRPGELHDYDPDTGYKNRDINDYHHAQYALCLGVAGQFAVNRGFFDNGAVSDGAANAYNIFSPVRKTPYANRRRTSARPRS